MFILRKEHVTPVLNLLYDRSIRSCTRQLWHHHSLVNIYTNVCRLAASQKRHPHVLNRRRQNRKQSPRPTPELLIFSSVCLSVIWDWIKPLWSTRGSQLIKTLKGLSVLLSLGCVVGGWMSVAQSESSDFRGNSQAGLRPFRQSYPASNPDTSCLPLSS